MGQYSMQLVGQFRAQINNQTYDGFREQGFEILSVSADNSASDVVKFRQGKWAMPWKNAFLDERKHPMIDA